MKLTRIHSLLAVGLVMLAAILLTAPASVSPAPDTDGRLVFAVSSPITLTVNPNTFSPAEANS